MAGYDSDSDSEYKPYFMHSFPEPDSESEDDLPPDKEHPPEEEPEILPAIITVIIHCTCLVAAGKLIIGLWN